MVIITLFFGFYAKSGTLQFSIFYTESEFNCQFCTDFAI